MRAERSDGRGAAVQAGDGPRRRRGVACGDESVVFRASLGRRAHTNLGGRSGHSHSIVAGGLELTSYTTRFTPRTWLMMRLEIRPSTSCGKGYQSAVMPSVLVTARSATTFSYVR